jgi:hypothetical protein
MKLKMLITVGTLLITTQLLASGVEPDICKFSWKEKPGYTDYTTRDEYDNTSAKNADRPQSKTLLGNSKHKNSSLCQRAKRLKPCLTKVITNSNSRAANAFKKWASRVGVNPVTALLAKMQQETKIGKIKDTCRSGSCNGIGIGQIITAIAPNGASLSVSDRRWKGITFNILTNLQYSVRVIKAKLPRSGSLWDLAYFYNGSNAASSYANKVSDYYSQLKKCGL